MIEYICNDAEERYEFLYVKDDKACCAFLPYELSEDEKIKFLTNWFNQLLRAINEQETPSQ